MAITLNIMFYFLFQVIGTFLHFLIFGSGESSVKYILWVALFFCFLQLVLLFVLFKSNKIIRNRGILIFNILVVAAMFLYFNVYLPGVTEF